ncbi:MAG: tetratricopeptide repeat protein [Bradymonadia bacterium]
MRYTLTFSLALWLMSCAAQGIERLPSDLQQRVPPTAPGARAALADGLGALWDGDLDAASVAFNAGLQAAPQDAHLHFFNAYVYDLRAEAGAQKSASLAEVGYRLALRFNPHHWAAAYRLGRLLWRQRRGPEAREAFAQAARSAPERPEPLYGLVVAAYNAGDPKAAQVALERLPPAASTEPQIQRAHGLVSAAMGDHDAAAHHLKIYRNTGGAAPGALAQRLHTWRTVHEAMQATSHAVPVDTEESPHAEDSNPKTPEAAKMVVFDAVVLSQENSTSSQRGVNLLSALQVQFGSTLLDASRSTNRDVTTGAVTSFEESGSSSVSISMPEVTYSLNIANASDSHNEIVARPSVVAHDNEESEVFIGSEVTYIAPGQLGGSSYNKEVGITLNVRPTFLEDDRLRVSVRTEFGAFLPTAAPGTFEQAVATVKNRTSVTAELAFGQTIALAAGNTKRRSNSRSGVPILRDIPILQYLFSTTSESEQNATLIILLTPRRPLQLNDKGQLSEGGVALSRQLQDRFSDFLKPTRNNLTAFSNARGSALHREFRRGDLTFTGVDLPEEDLDTPSAAGRRGRRFLRDVLETLYF